MNKKYMKERLKNGEIVIGTWNVISSPALVEAIGYSGLDFIVIDAEHGPINMESAENLIRAIEVTGAAPIIRVTSNEADLILRALDIGAYGVQVPHITTKKQAASVVAHAKYHPQGQRGLSPFTRAAKYGMAADHHVVQSNENTAVIVQVEGVEGVKNLKEIASVPSIDVIFIGPYDLSQSLGKPGDVDDPEVIDLIKDSARVIKNEGKVCGSFAKDEKYLEILVNSGIQYITYTVESQLITQTCKKLTESLRKLIK